MKYRIVIPCQVMQEHPAKLGAWNRAIELTILDAESADEAMEQVQKALRNALEETNSGPYRKFDGTNVLSTFRSDSESPRSGK